MKGLIAIDLDGTLFNSSQQISNRNKQAIEKAISNDYKTAIVTGRGREGAIAVLDGLGIDMPVICSAGSLILENKDSKVISSRTFQIDDELNIIVEFAMKFNSGIITDTLDGNWWFGPDELEDSLDPLTAAFASNGRRTFNPKVDLKRPLLKLTLAAEPEILQKAEESVGRHCPSLHYVYAGMNYLDFTRKDVNKGSALKILAGYLEIKPDDTIAIGDQLIDLSMLEFAGLPIAMSNAPQRLKQAARWIAPTNDEDGVAWALDRIIHES